ncbi:MAG: hypothetical protein PHV33_06420 [Elusimicrobiales bacterium]|nr:hypothetical protein [Elusimicrobiales bacterium]
MNDEEREKKLLSLLAPRRSEAFWAAQRSRALAGTAGKRASRRAWLLAPAAALAALLVILSARAPHRQPPADSPAVSTAFIEHLDLLDDMDVLEAIGEEDL